MGEATTPLERQRVTTVIEEMENDILQGAVTITIRNALDRALHSEQPPKWFQDFLDKYNENEARREEREKKREALDKKRDEIDKKRWAALLKLQPDPKSRDELKAAVDMELGDE